MPLYRFECASCRLIVRKILSVSASSSVFYCQCGNELKRSPTGPTSQTMERLDNGWMKEAIERPADIERMMAERSAKDPMEEK